MTFQNIEKARIKYRNTILKDVTITFGVEASIVAFAFLCAKAAGYENMFETTPILAIGTLICVTIIIISIMITFIKSKAKEYKKTYKAYFVKQAAAQFLTNLSYNHEKGLDKKILDGTQMINTGDRYSSNDLMTGKYKNIMFSQSDITIEKEIEWENSSSYYKIFKGQFMIIDFPKKFNYKLEVVSNHFRANKIPNKFEQFEVESPKFNKKFKIYSDDGFETFCLLNPNIIEKIEKLSLKYDKKMIICFSDNKICIGVDNDKDLFEPPNPFKKINEQEEKSKVREHTKLITNFIDELF